MTEPAATTLTLQQAAAREWQVVVIGAGPAGAIAAHRLASAGCRVLLVDRCAFPRWKVCGCCISARSVDMLRGMGLGHVVRSGSPLTSLRVASRGGSAEVPIRGGQSLSRLRMDEALRRAAMNRGACFLRGAATVRPSSAPVLVRTADREAELRAGLIIAADGLQGSSLRDLPAFTPRIAESSRIGLGAVLRPHSLPPPELPPGSISMACAAAGYVGMVRLEDGSVELAAAVDPPFLRSHASPAAAMGAILSQAGAPTPDFTGVKFTGTPLLTRRRRVEHGRIFVAGDAAGYVEPFTGEGIAWAIASGLAVAEHARAALTGAYTRGRWTAEHARIIKRRQLACRALAAVLRRPRITRGAIAAASAAPALASILAASIHGRSPERACP